MSFDLLSEPIRKYIREKGWEQLRPIQNAAINKIITTDDNYILASKTASGKTEAAFLPIISKLNFNESGVLVLYISPLIALINDQFNRIEDLCKYVDVTVTKWHGEANKALKDRLLKQPNGILLITPESLEAMFINKPQNARILFSNLKYTVIDEIHSFIGTDRGVQLISLISRLQIINLTPFSIVGLSATIGDYNEAKKITGDIERTKVLLDKSPKEIYVQFKYFESKNEELPINLLKDLYTETKNSSVLIFPNSRGRTEEIAVKMKKISEKVNGHPFYFSHHSSVDKNVRTYVEHFAKNNIRDKFCICCTSTLELGIDIGTVDLVVQIDATHNISSLIQRIGRSGRREGEISKLLLYATNEWSLLQSLACWLLYKDGYIEPPLTNEKPYDILVHQALSITKGHSGIKLSELIQQIHKNFAFCKIPMSDVENILDYLIKIDLLEKIKDEVIIGIQGEYIVNNRDFYSVFKTEENYNVINEGNAIGSIPFSPQIIEGENILLAAYIWKISLVDHDAKKIYVIPAKDGKKPFFNGDGRILDQKIREKMLQILYSNIEYEFLDDSGCKAINTLRNFFSCFNIVNLETDRPIIAKDTKCTFFSFTSTRINRTIQQILNINGITNRIDESNSSFEIEIVKEELISKLNSLDQMIENIDSQIGLILDRSSDILNFSKWAKYLSPKYQIELLKEKYFDFEGAKTYFSRVKLVYNNPPHQP